MPIHPLRVEAGRKYPKIAALFSEKILINQYDKYRLIQKYVERLAEYPAALLPIKRPSRHCGRHSKMRSPSRNRGWPLPSFGSGSEIQAALDATKGSMAPARCASGCHLQRKGTTPNNPPGASWPLGRSCLPRRQDCVHVALRDWIQLAGCYTWELNAGNQEVCGIGSFC